MSITALGLVIVSLVPQSHRVKASPFDGMRWSQGQPQVQVAETWYVPVAIDGIGVEKIFAFIDRRWRGQREKRFSEDLVEALVAIGWEGDLQVDLDMRSVADGAAVLLENVE
ncbi:MAG: hypothetical protein QF412_07870, partial [Planctomycetota bacterium]|nr:hypothetical protein [Planctomycetota bacterium]